ncbi:MAG: response regulator transcription factor [Oscillospiraceae bacterium]|nr:response regulator transcription factor [Oscillospiraceae bacterium]
MRLLIAEDDSDLREVMAKKLKAEGYAVDACSDGREALDFLELADYDAAVLDIMMPKMDGLELVRRLREKGKLTPIIFLTARDAVSDRVKGLDGGANDYLTKPFSFEELTARLRALTRTASQKPLNIYTVGDLSLNIETREVERAGRRIELTATEFALLEYLMRNAGRALSRQKIEDHIWNCDYEGGTNVVDVYIAYLRRKIDEGHEQKLIRTLRGIGYTIRDGQ